MEYKIILKKIGLLLILLNSNCVVCQVDIDTVMLSHSPFLEYAMGFALAYTNYSNIDHQKLHSKNLTREEKNEIKSKYFPEKLEFIATHEGWINPLSLFKIQNSETKYYFTFPSSTYKLELNKFKEDLILIPEERSNLWKYDGQTIKLVLHYKDSLCPETKKFTTKIPYEFIMAEHLKGLTKFEIVIENELKHQLKIFFRIW